MSLIARQSTHLFVISSQSLGIMRNAFSSVIQKRVYTFHFDRMSKQSSDLAALTATVQKMDRARRERAIV